MTRILVSKAVSRTVRREKLADEILSMTAKEAEYGTIRAALGDETFKVDIARQGRGKSHGYRALLGIRPGCRAYFAFLWPKNEFENISDDYLAGLKALVKGVMTWTTKHCRRLLRPMSYGRSCKQRSMRTGKPRRVDMAGNKMKIDNKKNEALVGIEILAVGVVGGLGKIRARKRPLVAEQDAKASVVKTHAQKSGAGTIKRNRKIIPAEVSGPTYKDDLAAAIHEGLAGLAAFGAVSETAVRSFEKVALKAVPRYAGDRVRELRLREKATQAVFALHLGVSVNTISQWERGEREVAGAAAKLLSLVEERGLGYLV